MRRVTRGGCPSVRGSCGDPKLFGQVSGVHLGPEPGGCASRGMPSARCPKALHRLHLRGWAGARPRGLFREALGEGKKNPTQINKNPHLGVSGVVGAAGTGPWAPVPPPCSRGRQSSTAAAAGARAVPGAGTGVAHLPAVGTEGAPRGAGRGRQLPSGAPGLSVSPRRHTASCEGAVRSVAPGKRRGGVERKGHYALRY